MLEMTQEKFETLDFEELICDCIDLCDDFCTCDEVKEYAADTIKKDNYILAIHLLEALRDNSSIYFYYDMGMGTFMEPQPITCKEDLLNTGYIVFTDAK